MARDLPERYPPYQTCHRRFQQWTEEGVLDEVLRALSEDLKDRGGLDLSECFVDGTFVGAKKGGAVGEAKRGKGTKLVALADASGLPISVCAASASPYEVTLVGEVLAAGFLEERPERLIGDRGSDPLDAGLAEEGIEMIAPHWRNRKKKLKPGASSGATRSGAGRSSVSSLGSTTSGGWWCATSDGCTTTWAWRSWGHRYTAQAFLR